MRYVLFVAFGAAVLTIMYLAAGPSPRITIGERGMTNWTPAAFSPDGKTILARGFYRVNDPMRIFPYNEILKLFDSATGFVIREYTLSNPTGSQQINQVEFSSDGAHIFACGNDVKLVAWETQSGKEIRPFSHGGKSVDTFSLTPDGSALLSAGTTLRLYDTKSGKLLKEANVADKHPTPSPQIHFSKDQKYFVLNSAGPVSIWDSHKMEMRFLSQHIRAFVPEKRFRLPDNIASRGVVLAPDGQGLLVTSTDGKITEIDLESAKEKRSFALNTDTRILGVVLSPKGDRLLTTGFSDQGFDSEVRLYSFPECKELKRFPGYGRVQFSPDGKTALTFTKDGRMMLWDLDK